jgi:hypothetical protein
MRRYIEYAAIAIKRLHDKSPLRRRRRTEGDEATSLIYGSIFFLCHNIGEAISEQHFRKCHDSRVHRVHALRVLLKSRW